MAEGIGIHRPVDEWPLLICGPMLRRVTKDSVAVFVATREPCTVRVSVFADNSTVAGSQPTPTRAIGQRLHVSVCEAHPPAGDLAPGKTYEYDVALTPSSGGPEKNLKGLGLLEGKYPLGYKENQLPTFCMPPADLAELRIVHASCRKPHGGGVDALWILDRLIENPLRRPHQLFLTGDQIYADDVAVTLLSTLVSVARELIGNKHDEVLPVDNLKLGDVKVGPGFRRSDWLIFNAKKRGWRRDRGLTSTEMDNHLVFFAEFCAMYLMVWSDVLWAPGKPPGAASYLLDEVDDKHIGVWYPQPPGDPPAYTRIFPREQATTDRIGVLDFASLLPRVRRALANVSTMMMFDDHEVTDDWNFDHKWVKASREMPVVQRIVRNGLLAQAVFQAWGNDPGRFASGRGKELLDLLTAVGSGSAPLAQSPDAANQLLNIAGGGDSASDDRVLWDWVLEGPKHRVIGLDTRTHRKLDPKTDRAGLLTDAEMDRQLKTVVDERLTFVISPTPVIGHPFVENIVTPTAVAFTGPRTPDAEAWSEDRATFLRFVHRLGQLGRVVLLSGDVHYSYTQRVGYFAPNKPAARIVQLCSSASKNAEGKTKLMQWKRLDPRRRGLLGFADIPPADARRITIALLLDGPNPENLRDWPATLGTWAEAALRPQTSLPAFYAASLWQSPAMVDVLNDLIARNGAGDVQLGIEFLRDGRTESERLADPVGDAPTTTGSRKFVADFNRGAVGYSNIGEVTLLANPAGEITIRHRLLIPHENVSNAVVASCLHQASLALPQPTERPEVR